MRKQITMIMTVLLVGSALMSPCAIAAKSRGSSGPKKPIIPKPDTVEKVDAGKFEIKVASGQKDRRVTPYTITAFTKIYVNNKPSKLEDVQKGMRVNVVSTDGKSASRIDASDYAGTPGDKKK